MDPAEIRFIWFGRYLLKREAQRFLKKSACPPSCESPLNLRFRAPPYFWLAVWKQIANVGMNSSHPRDILTNNVSVVFMARDIMILMGANPFWGPTPSNGPSNGFVPIKIFKSKRHIKKQLHWYFYVHKFCCRCILYSVFFILYCMLWVLCDFLGQPRYPF